MGLEIASAILFEKKEEDLAKKLANVAATQDEVNTIKRSQLEVLEKISGLTQEEADFVIRIFGGANDGESI